MKSRIVLALTPLTALAVAILPGCSADRPVEPSGRATTPITTRAFTPV